MKVLGISGSPRREGNTDILVEHGVGSPGGRGVADGVSLAGRSTDQALRGLPGLFCLGHDPLRSGGSRL